MKYRNYLFLFIFFCNLAGGVFAQAYPTKPIRFIVPVPPGGGADFVARAYASRLGDALGQQVVVDNRGGAAGIIAMEATAKRPRTAEQVPRASRVDATR